jgi:hypothetical protein
MTLTQFFSTQLEREGARTRAALTSVPEGKDDWKPHGKSMPLLRLAGLVAGMVATLDKGMKDGRAALESTTDDYLLTTKWKLLVKGRVVMEQPRTSLCSRRSIISRIIAGS